MRWIIASVLLVLVFSTAHSQSQSTLDKMILEDQLAGKSALVSDRDSLRAILEVADATPLDAIGEENLPGFVDSLVFTEFGLASLNSVLPVWMAVFLKA